MQQISSTLKTLQGGHFFWRWHYFGVLVTRLFSILFCSSISCLFSWFCFFVILVLVEYLIFFCVLTSIKSRKQFQFQANIFHNFVEGKILFTSLPLNRNNFFFFFRETNYFCFTVTIWITDQSGVQQISVNNLTYDCYLIKIWLFILFASRFEGKNMLTFQPFMS